MADKQIEVTLQKINPTSYEAYTRTHACVREGDILWILLMNIQNISVLIISRLVSVFFSFPRVKFRRESHYFW